MANPEHLAILKQGVKEWNEWRKQHPEIQPDLNGADLSDANLLGADLSSAYLDGAHLNGANLNNINLSGAHLVYTYLRGANLVYANLSRAFLTGVNLGRADLSDANLSDTYLVDANLSRANLGRADLSEANLGRADLSEANLGYARLCGANLSCARLNGANLSHANLGLACLNGSELRDADLSEAILSSADLSGVTMGHTIFAELDLREVKGLTRIQHLGRSRVELHTVQLPQDGSALHFLRGCGVPDEWIDFWRSTAMNPIQYHSCFISYSSKDDVFARRLDADLQAQGVRCWFAPEDMKIGDKIRSRIDEAIHLQEKLLLLLSEHALSSVWVEDEVEAAFAKERDQKREVLFPIRLDETIMHTSQAWAKKLRDTRHIGDFTRWTDPQAYERSFERLLRDLKRASE